MSIFGASEITRRVRDSPEQAGTILEGVLGAIERLDGEIGAWVHVSRDGARRAAALLKRRRSIVRAPLAGVPVGVKDIIDVAGMPTRAGAASFAHRTPNRDANVVSRLRRAGAIIVGKTATTEFAFSDPAGTRNPWNPDHTPGGSSSGSAAAVAAGMVPAALGTQTIGSVLRPAAYCGIVGFKPSFGAISTDGVIPLAWSFDHVGVLARSVADAGLVFSATAARGRRQARRPRRRPGGLADIRVGALTALAVSRAVPDVAAHLGEIANRLAVAGATVDEAELAHPAEWLECGRTIMAAEAATFHQDAFPSNEGDYRPQIAALVSAGLNTRATAYVRALQARDALRVEASALFRDFDVLLLPVAPAPAPAGLTSTGDPAFCAPATFSGLPSISLPSGLDRSGLPLALQLVAGPRSDRQLLEVAAMVERLLAFDARPRLLADRSH